MPVDSTPTNSGVVRTPLPNKCLALAGVPGKLDFCCKANKCSDDGIGDLGVLTTQEILSQQSRLLSVPLVMPAQSAEGALVNQYESC